MFNSPDGGVAQGRSPYNFIWMLMGGQGSKRRRNVAENFNRLSRVHERYRQTGDRQTTDDRRTDDDIYSERGLMRTLWPEIQSSTTLATQICQSDEKKNHDRQRSRHNARMRPFQSVQMCRSAKLAKSLCDRSKEVDECDGSVTSCMRRTDRESSCYVRHYT